MNIKTGYKQTEIGVIPDDWKVKHLKEISPKQSVGLVINPSTYFEESGTVPMLVGSNIGENKIDWLSSNRITEESNKRLPASRLNAGDLVMVRVGEPGTTAVIPKELDGCNCASMMIIRKASSFNSEWLCFMMNSTFGRNQVEGVQYGTAQKQFNISDAVNFSYPFPSKQEQTAIAAALSDVDTLMGELDKLIAKKRDIKQATMQQLLTGKKRLAGFSGEWEVKRLGEVAEIIGGGTPSTFVSDYWNGNINWFTPTEIGTEKYVFDSVRKITKDGLINCSARILPIGTILLTSRAGIGDIGILKKEACTNQGFQSLVVKDGFYNEFLYYLVSTLKNVLIQNASGSTFLEISPNKIKQIQISIPTIEEQTAIATILSDMDAEINALQQKRDKTAQLKQGMMQELLTGRIRLNPQESTPC